MRLLDCTEHNKPTDGMFDCLVAYIDCNFNDINDLYKWLSEKIDGKSYTMKREGYDDFGYTENETFKIVIYDFADAVEFKLRWC